MEFEFIKDAVKVKTYVKGLYSEIIEDWLYTDNRTLKFRCANAEERKKVYAAVSAFKRNHNLDYTVYCERGTNNIFLVKA